jgi:hypothetical protein
MEVPTPADGNATQRIRRPVPAVVKIGLPMGAIGGLCLIALGWVWNTDRNQVLDHQRLEDVKSSHESLRSDVKGDLKEIRQKLDDLRDLVLRGRP